MSSSHRRALDAPAGELVVLSRSLVEEVAEASRTSPRRRITLPLHKSESEPLHRMLNVIQPDSYVRPHRHLEPPKPEAWVVLRGALAFFTFEEDGRVRDCLSLEAGGEQFGVDLVPGIYHGLVALVPDTVLFEVKSGPYAPAHDKSFAPWAPAEGTPEAVGFLARLREEFRRRFPEEA
ncbi:WbuC family cupin fold metalloprotein [Vitiosangium sp. GDMCC 1.1324]|uniref:WbuC family cupin fold metalloprotein n=1 Tax=Vitiosangium sp. (strain GDMCC 1.1324) TaxID=2138576 RepID=UPI000D3C850A|nr:WbuC family cupin fold metalloprotein [Vitiosangium sp. GDMCC 1.1324]PTL76699.1 cupin fold metalloprotein, WbuC family [Vitiosangium sp. GDMCC 1.1324]